MGKRSRVAGVRLSRRRLLQLGIGGLATTIATREPTTARASTQPLARGLRALGRLDAHIVGPRAVGTASTLILVDGGSGNALSAYVAEILRAEGIRDVEQRSLADLSPSLLAGRSVVILCESAPSSGQVADLEAYVSAGGGLIVMRPSAALAALCGIAVQSGQTSEAYFRITDPTVGGGLYSGTMQFHGTSSHLAPAGAATIAQLYSSRTSSTSFAAVTVNVFGAGAAAAFSFDVGRSVVLTRQGNPANADADADGDGLFRTNDLYFGWVDLERVSVPQADMLQRLLVRVIEAVRPEPTPRLWLFPNTYPTVLVATGDAHANPESYHQAMVDAFSQRNMGITFYVTQSGPSPAAVATWRAQGFDFAPHPYVDGGYSSGYSAAFADFQHDYGFVPRTVRTHQVRWSGWTTAASIAAQQGTRMTFDPYEWGSWVRAASGPVNGYLSGSGLPMRFMDSSGTLLDIYGQHTALVDEQLAPEVGVLNVDLDTGLALARQTIDESVNGYHTPIVTQFHVDYFSWGGVNAWVLQSTDHALQQGVQPMTADAWLTFVEQRAASAISSVVWSNSTLSFTCAASGTGQTLLLPMIHRGAALTGIQRNGSPLAYSTMSINGRSYAVVPLSSASFAASYAADTIPPTLSAVTATPQATSATITWTTNEPASTLVSYGVDGNLNQQASAPGLSTQHSVVLTDLQANTTYDYRASSTDAAQNTGISGLLTFQTLPPGAPILQAIDPTSSQQGATQAVILTGQNFLSGATARVGTTPLADVVVQSATTISATVPASTPVGTHDVVVSNPDGQSSTLSGAYRVLAPPPTISGVTPPGVVPGQQFTVTGAGFAAGATVRIGSTAANTAVSSATAAVVTTPLSMPAGQFDVSLTNPDGQSATLPQALTVDPLPSVGHTTVADFAGGTTTQTAVVSGGIAGDGAVALAAAGWSDDFVSPQLDPSRWAQGTWDPNGAIQVASGTVSLTGAWMRSNATISGGSVRARLTFSSAAFQNFGLSRSDDLDNPWILFGVPGFDTSSVYARINIGSTLANVKLNGYIGAPHDFEIQYAAGIARFLVDDVLVHQTAIPNAGLLATWISAGTTGPAFQAHAVTVASYSSAGAFQGAALDAGQGAQWVQLSVAQVKPAGSTLSVRARTSFDRSTWSAWSPAVSSFPYDLALPDGRYLQYECQLTTTDASVSSLMLAISATYQATGGAAVASVEVTPASVSIDPGQHVQFSARALDGQGQELPDATFTWSVVNGGGTIDGSGLFVAGTTPGTFVDTVAASSSGVPGYATVSIAAPPGPVVQSISPASARAGKTVTVTGLNFDASATVRLNGTIAATTQVQSAQELSFTVPQVAPGLYDVTVRNPDGQFGTLVDALTVTTLLTATHTTVADFTAGTRSGTEIRADIGDGAVALAFNGVADEFNGSVPDPALWDTGTWQPDGSVNVASGSILISGAWARSVSTLASGSVTIRATFPGIAWHNIGLSRTDDIGNPWFLFGTPGWDPGNVYIRVDHGSAAENIRIDGFVGTPHDFTIQYGAGQVRFLVDGVVVHELTSSVTAALAVWLSSGISDVPLVVDTVHIGAYLTQGTFLSAPFDAGDPATWELLTPAESILPATSVRARARTSDDASAWSAWSPQSAAFPMQLSLPAGRYLQYELELTTNGSATPVVSAVTGEYELVAPTPTAVEVSPSSTSLSPGQTQQFSAVVIQSSGQAKANAAVTWRVINGGGTISATGMFTAGSTPGTYTDTVEASSGGQRGLASVSILNPAPVITSVTPSTGRTAGGDQTTISGANFLPGSEVRLGGALATTLQASAGSITVTTPPGAPGPVDVTITLPDGQTATLSGGFIYIAPPEVTGLTPSSGPTDSTTQVTITGTGFTDATEVWFGATQAVSFAVTADTSIAATAPSGQAGTVDVRVMTPYGTSAQSAQARFTYVAPPVISALTPTSGIATATTQVTISGSGFTGTTQVRFGAATASFTVTSDNAITATAPAGQPGTVDVTVTTPYGVSVPGPSSQFTYHGVPSVASISPTGGPTAGGTQVTVTGQNFTGVSGVAFGTTSASYVVASPTQLIATSPPRSAGTVDVRVTNPAGTSAAVAADRFTYYNAPAVTSVSPNIGSTAGGTTVTINGRNFTGTSAVTFGTVPAASFTVVSASQIRAVSPPHAAGRVNIRITTPGGTSGANAASRFTYI